MSLARSLLRLATVRSLSGQTLAGTRVFDSSVDPLDHRIKSDPEPIVIIYTDAMSGAGDGRADMGATTALCELVIELAVANKTTVRIATDGEDEEAVAIDIPPTDAGMELTLDILERQIMARLHGGVGVWPEVWRLFVARVEKRTSQRAANADSASRFASRQIVLTVQTLVEPSVGAAVLVPGTAWQKALEAMEADSALRGLAPVIRSELAGEAPDWLVACRELGLNRDGLLNIGLGPLAGMGDETPLLTDIELRGVEFESHEP